MDPGPVHALQIRPAEVTEVWAGLLLVHGLSHLQDVMRGALGPAPTRGQVLQGEVRAYSRMLAAADPVAGGRLRPAIESLIDRWHPSSIAALAERADTLELADVELLNRTLPADTAVSQAEFADRCSFFGVALLIRFAETHPMPLAELLSALDHVAAAGRRDWRQ